MLTPRECLALTLALACRVPASAQDEAARARSARVLEARRVVSELLARGEVRERSVRIADLARARRVWLVNAVRGRVEVRLA